MFTVPQNLRWHFCALRLRYRTFLAPEFRPNLIIVSLHGGHGHTQLLCKIAFEGRELCMISLGCTGAGCAPKKGGEIATRQYTPTPLNFTPGRTLAGQEEGCKRPRRSLDRGGRQKCRLINAYMISFLRNDIINLVNDRIIQRPVFLSVPSVKYDLPTVCGSQ